MAFGIKPGHRWILLYCQRTTRRIGSDCRVSPSFLRCFGHFIDGVHQLKSQEKRLREAVETIPTMTFPRLPDGSNTFVNKRWIEYSGAFCREDFRPKLAACDPCRRPCAAFREVAYLRFDQTAFRRRGAVPSRANGEYRWFLVRGVLRIAAASAIGAAAMVLAAYDGANMWVANTHSNNVTKLRGRDGALLGTFAVGFGPTGICLDGANMWVTNVNTNTVTKQRASDGHLLGTFTVGGSNAAACAFDGANIWVANNGSSNVSKLRASDGHLLGTFPTGMFPSGVAFDGAKRHAF